MIFAFKKLSVTSALSIIFLSVFVYQFASSVGAARENNHEIKKMKIQAVRWAIKGLCASNKNIYKSIRKIDERGRRWPLCLSYVGSSLAVVTAVLIDLFGLKSDSAAICATFGIIGFVASAAIDSIINFKRMGEKATYQRLQEENDARIAELGKYRIEDDES